MVVIMMKRILARALSLAAAGIPLVFASIRAMQTGWDFRYFLIAVAGLLGAAAPLAFGRRYPTGHDTFAITIAAFVVAVLLSILAAMAIGTRLGPGLIVVAGSFAACSAAAVFFHLYARGGNQAR